jgi:hypothetical protein
LVIVQLSRSAGIFSSLYLGLHRVAFQESVQRSLVPIKEKLFFPDSVFSIIKWEDEEFEWENKMYDVSKIEKTKGGFFIYCVNDEEEDNFICLFKSCKETNVPNALYKPQFQPQYCNQLIVCNADQARTMAAHCSSLRESYDSPWAKAISPPPEYYS